MKKLAAAIVAMLGVAASISASAAADATSPPSGDPAARCAALAAADFSGTPDAPTRITSAALVPASEGASAYCEVRGTVAPTVEFALRLPPERWNGRFVELGCGGSCGSTQHVANCAEPLRRGYACIVSNGGHASNGRETSWAAGNPQAMIGYLVRASYVTALAGKAIVARYHARGPERSYFMGCSAGGIQAMWLAQRFPTAFDGIVAGAPALRMSHNWLGWIAANRALMGGRDEPLLAAADLERVNRAVVAKCDSNDGVRDGLIGDPRECPFDPGELQCTAARTPECLTPVQVDTVRRIYAGPVDSRGRALAAPIALRGSETTWLQWFTGSRNRPTPVYEYMKDAYRYSVFALDFGAAWFPEQFDFDVDPARLGAMAALEPTHPDLRAFRARGGRLLAYTGWSDAVEGVHNTIDYYDTVERVMGGRSATQEFFRLFVVPGMEHCSGGPGAYFVDYLGAIEGWVERGAAPDRLVGSHVKIDDLLPKAMAGDAEALRLLRKRFVHPLDPAYVEFSRPIHPYPTGTRYAGHGDPTRADSFVPDAAPLRSSGKR